MDHGNPSIAGATVWFCSDEHVTFAPRDGRPAVGERVRVVPAHVDPTMAMHEVAWLVEGDDRPRALDDRPARLGMRRAEAPTTSRGWRSAGDGRRPRSPRG